MRQSIWHEEQIENGERQQVPIAIMSVVQKEVADLVNQQRVDKSDH
jgi:hypothetical protein